MSGANAQRGEAALRLGGELLVLRPTFAALVAAEEELGPLFALVERMGTGGLRLAEAATLCWHCLRDPPPALTRDALGEGLAELGLAGIAPVVGALVAQILRGR